MPPLDEQQKPKTNFIFKNKIFIFYKMEPIKKQSFYTVNQQEFNKPKNQSVEGVKIYKTRKYVQSTRTKITAEARRKRDQYLIDHKEEILKMDHIGRVKKVAELLKQELNLNICDKSLYTLLNKYGLTSKNTEERKLRDKYLLDHMEEIKKLDSKGKIKKVQEMIKRDLNLYVNYNKMYVAFNKFNLG